MRAQHRDADAATILEEYLQQHNADSDVLTELAKLRIAQKNLTTAQTLLLRAIDANPESLSANLLLGHLLLVDHKNPEAMDRFETVLTKDPRNADAGHGELNAVTELAMEMRRKQQPELALKALLHARQALPDNSSLLLELGIQETELGMTTVALESLHHAHTIDPGNPEVIYALARAEMDAQQMSLAESDFRAYLSMRPKDASAHFGLGRVLEALQRTVDARAEFMHSLALQPDQTESNYELGQMDLEAGNFNAAEPLFSKTLARDSKHGGALTGMGVLAYRRKQYDKAEGWLLQAIDAAPNYPPAHYYRGLNLARLGRKEESDKELAIATELDHREQAPAHPLPQDGASGTFSNPQ